MTANASPQAPRDPQTPCDLQTPRDADPFAYLADVVTAAGALTAARRMGVLERLDRGAADAATLAADCGLSSDGAALLLDALTAMGVVRADRDGLHHPGGIRPRDLGRLLSLGDGLPESLRTGVSAVAAGTPSGAGQLYPGAVAHIGSLMADPAAAVAERLAAAGVTFGEVLDVGAGAAPWSLALARRAPGCHVTALELPAVLPATRAAVDAAGCADQFTFRPGDVLTADLPHRTYDLILVGNLCHLFDNSTNQNLLTRLAVALRPGGSLAILDVLPDTPAADRRAAALYALGLYARASQGGLHPFTAYQQWLSTAGLPPPSRADVFDAPPVTLIHTQLSARRCDPPHRPVQ